MDESLVSVCCPVQNPGNGAEINSLASTAFILS